jgi:hypothetical protein
MPAATPIPGSPSVVTVYTAADLLTGPGCPVCRYASEASERYFAWFALEAYAQTSTITRLSRALGAWRRAAAFLDGGAFCGCPPREKGGPDP